jgi:hypothetical protein
MAEIETRPDKDPVTGRFLAGNSGNGGRKRGSRNKLGETFIADLYADWQQHGPQVIETCRRNKPEVYLKVVASLLPKELEIKENPFDDFTDDQPHDLLAALRATIGVDQNASGSSETSH